jgi:hypothetical protein
MDTWPISPLLVVIVLLVPLAALAVIVAGSYLTAAAHGWRTYRGTHIVQCPETRKPAAVRVDTRHYARNAVMNDLPEVRLASCSRWPERAGCDQACVPQIERDPIDTRLDTILADVFTNHRCALCGRTISGVPAIGHKPAFRAPDGRTIPCDQIAPERIGEMLETHRLVCWDCDIAETFRREHPELVIDVPERRASR